MSITVTARVTSRGPIFRPAEIRRVVESEFGAANDTAERFVRTGANRRVNRAFGIYERGWHREPRQTGGGAIVRDVAFNAAPNAVMWEEGRRPGKGIPIQTLYAWIDLRGLGDGDFNNFRGIAIHISSDFKRWGWPNPHSIGQVPGQPPRPVGRSIETQAAAIWAAYQRAGSLIARRLG